MLYNTFWQTMFFHSNLSIISRLKNSLPVCNWNLVSQRYIRQVFLVFSHQSNFLPWPNYFSHFPFLCEFTYYTAVIQNKIFVFLLMPNEHKTVQIIPYQPMWQLTDNSTVWTFWKRPHIKKSNGIRRSVKSATIELPTFIYAIHAH